MAHRIPVGTKMLLDYVCLHAKKMAIPMAHRMLNNIETSLAKTSSCASTKAIPMEHAYPKATKHISKTSFRSTKMKATPMAHCIINRNVSPKTVLSERRYGRHPHGTLHIARHFSAFKHTCKKATSMAHHMPVGTEMSLNYV